MSKININSKISKQGDKSNLSSFIGIKNNNEITYKDDAATMFIIINKQEVLIRRQNDEIKLELSFKLNEKCYGKYFIKQFNMYINVSTKTKVLKIEENKVYIEYDLYMDDELSDGFVYIIEWSDLNES